MKTEDLSIGDWVNYGGRFDKIERVSIYGIVVLEKNHSEQTWVHQLSPITITNGILIKNGFEKHEYVGNYEVWESEDGRTIISHISNMNGRNWSVHIDNEDFQSICSADFEYVHELQHILRHCEIKKEIKL